VIETAHGHRSQTGSPANNVDGICLRATGLVKSFRARKVVKGVSIEVRAGEVVGLLGPNGAGKPPFLV